MRLIRRKKQEVPRPQGDPEGVERARRVREKAEHALHRDRREVIEPLKQELYKNNIQEMIEELLNNGRRKRGNGPTASTDGC